MHLPVRVVRPQGGFRIIRLSGQAAAASSSSLACCRTRRRRETLLGGSGQVGDIVRLAGVNQELRGGLNFLAQLAAEERLCLAPLFRC